MKKKLIGIVICTLLIATAVLPVSGTIDYGINRIEKQNTDSLTSKDGVIVSTDLYYEKIIENKIVDRSDNPTIVDYFVKESNPLGQQLTTLIGCVYDEVTGEGVEGAEVTFGISVSGGLLILSDTTNETGEYIIEVTNDHGYVSYATVSKSGYNTLEFVYVELVLSETNANDFYLNTRPTAHADGTSYYGSRGYFDDAIELNGNGYDPNGNIVLYEWDFDGDGTYDWQSEYAGSTTHVYENVGNYSIILTFA